MNDLAPEVRDDLPQPAARGDDSLAGLEPDFWMTPTMLRSAAGASGPDDKVGSAQDKDMQGMVFEHEGVIDQFANFAAGRGRLDFVEVVERLGGGDMMGSGADSAYPAGNLRHLLGRAAEAKHLESAQFGHLHIGAL